MERQLRLKDFKVRTTAYRNIDRKAGRSIYLQIRDFYGSVGVAGAGEVLVEARLEARLLGEDRDEGGL